MNELDRREFLKLAGKGVVFASGRRLRLRHAGGHDFHFIQLSDIHWGYDNAAVNPDFRGTLPKAIAAVNGLAQKPDFVVFTGDLTQTTDDPKLRRARLKEFRDIAAGLSVPKVYYFAGEHDAALDRGEAYQEFFGETLRYTFDHKGVHFIVLDNTSDPAPILGAQQIAWLKADLANSANQPIVV
jgi:3',5'-cyclic AMP phosphodiesterase CpdA